MGKQSFQGATRREQWENNESQCSAQTSFLWVTAVRATPRNLCFFIFGDSEKALSTILRFHQILRDPEESKVVPKASHNTLTTRKTESTGETLTAFLAPILGIARITGSGERRAERHRSFRRNSPPSLSATCSRPREKEPWQAIFF